MIIDLTLTREEKIDRIVEQCASSARVLWDNYFKTSPNPCYTLIEDLAEMCTIVDELMKEHWIPEEKNGTRNNQRTF